jgi:hypothetical protein
MADCRAIAKFNQQKRLALKLNLELGRSLWHFFEEINALKRQLKPEKTAKNKKSIKEC